MTSNVMRMAVLVTLVLQNSALALFMRYSRSSGAQQMYAATTAVVLAELIKASVSLVIQLNNDGGIGGFAKTMREDVLNKPFDLVKMAIPAGLYVVQNNLAYIAVSHLDGPTYQLLYQAKILTTAVFSVVMLKKSLSATQWLSLLALGLGVGLVQMSSTSGGSAAAAAEDLGEGGLEDGAPHNEVVGFAAVLLACCTSGFAGVYFEKVLKASKVSLWVRNMQLAGYGLLIGLGGVYMQDGDAVREHGFLHGYNFSVWMAVLLNSLGGLVVALVVQHADNVVKGFATSVSIVITCMVSWVLFDFMITGQFCIGAAMVLYSTYLYSQPSSPPPSKATELPLVDHVEEEEKSLLK